MKITTLIENLVYKSGLQAEHGLSLLIETENKKILFDTGQTGAFLINAEKLGVRINEIDAVVISHGHYDHTGGLYSFLQKNKKAKVYLKKEVFVEKFNHRQKFLGTVFNPLLLNDRIVCVDMVTEIEKGIFIHPDIPILDWEDTSFKNLQVRNDNGFEQDEFWDELFLTIVLDNKLSIISSCSHRGITNITREAIRQFHLPVQLILGGFHLKDTSTVPYNAVVSFFRELNPENIGVCHCTGIDKYADLVRDCSGNVFYNFTGNIITL